MRLDHLKENWMRVISQCYNVNRIFSVEDQEVIIEGPEDQQGTNHQLLNSDNTLRLLGAEFISSMRDTLCQDADTDGMKPSSPSLWSRHPPPRRRPSDVQMGRLLSSPMSTLRPPQKQKRPAVRLRFSSSRGLLSRKA